VLLLRQGTDDAGELEMTDYGQMVVHKQQVTGCSVSVSVFLSVRLSLSLFLSLCVLSHCALASCCTVYCNRSCLWVCLCVGGLLPR